MGLSAEIKARREELGMSKCELARRTKVTRQAIIRWERGKTAGITASYLIDLERALGLKPGELFKAKYEDTPNDLLGVN